MKAITVSFMTLALLAGSQATSAQSLTIQATIDKTCFPQARVFKVPDGKVAMNIKPTKFSAGGSTCPRGIKVKPPAWAISTGAGCLLGNVFKQNVLPKGKVTETPMALTNVKLKSGLWCLHVEGRMDALAEVTMNLVSAKAAQPGGPWEPTSPRPRR